MSQKESFEGEIAGILLKEDAVRYDPAHPLWSLNWLWVTKNQWKTILENQTKCYVVGEKVFCARDVKIRRIFTYDELRKEQVDWKPPRYLLEALEKEGGNAEV